MPRIPKELKDQALKMNEEGKTAREISEATGIKIPTLYNMFKKLANAESAPKKAAIGALSFSATNPYLAKAREWEAVQALIAQIDRLADSSRQMVIDHFSKK
ncbi:MAG: hypothetical protein H3C30_09150 [Candidatus Hydrogenedentes bacterium]|nr:hypothetical protein [Candidatus Hydrogenedentota bacterium]